MGYAVYDELSTLVGRPGTHKTVQGLAVRIDDEFRVGDEAEPGLQNSAPAGSFSAPEKKKGARAFFCNGVCYNTVPIPS